MTGTDTKNITKRTGEFELSLHHRETKHGNWVIELEHFELDEVAEMHIESEYKRALGVFWYLLGGQTIALELAEQYIRQNRYDRGEAVAG